MYKIIKIVGGIGIGVGVAFLAYHHLLPNSDNENIFFSEKRLIGIHPLGQFEKKLVDTIANTLKTVYGCDVIIYQSRPIPKSAFTNCKGGRYKANLLIKELKQQKPDTVDYSLGLLSKDIVHDKKDATTGKTKEPTWKYECWGILGLGYRPGPSCVVSSFRPRNAIKGDEKKYISTMLKICAHEVGHNFGLKHCENANDKKCFMRSAAEKISTVYALDLRLCSKCKAKL